MRIEWTPPLRPATQKRDDKGADADRSFSAAFEGDAAASLKLTGSAAVRTVEGLLALQEVADAQTGRRRAVARGTKLLDRLEELRVAILTGIVRRSDLEALVRLSRESAPLIDDPKLAEILADIELRAAVELAKLGAEV
jgi:hypothetical protein